MMLRYREIPPHPRLGEFVECYWTLERSETQATSVRESILPDGCVELIFNSALPIRRYDNGVPVASPQKGYFVGQMKRSVELEPTGPVSLLGVRFKAYGAWPFLDEPLSAMTDKIVDVESVWNGTGRELQERVLAARTVGAKIGIVETHLLGILRRREPGRDPRLPMAIRTMIAADGLIPIDHVAKSIGLGRRQLERRFADQVGITPKFYARIIRFQKIFKIIERAQRYEWQDVLGGCAYYDQSHVIKDFKFFCGQSPSGYFNAEQLIAPLFRLSNRKTYFYNTSP